MDDKDFRLLFLATALLGYIRGGFADEETRLAQGLIARANDLARYLSLEEIPTKEIVS